MCVLVVTFPEAGEKIRFPVGEPSGRRFVV
jgi:hypothetical protein